MMKEKLERQPIRHVFHFNIEKTNKLIDRAARRKNELQVKAYLIHNSASKYEEYLNKVLAFIRKVAKGG